MTSDRSHYFTADVQDNDNNVVSQKFHCSNDNDSTKMPTIEFGLLKQTQADGCIKDSSNTPLITDNSSISATTESNHEASGLDTAPVEDNDKNKLSQNLDSKVKRKDRPGDDAPSSFIQKLLEILTIDDYSAWINWLPHGKGFIIKDKKKLEEQVLPYHFNNPKLHCFIRKLSRWNFVKVTKGHEFGSYYHPMFQKGDARLANQISCRKQQSQRVPPSTVSPEFLALSSLKSQQTSYGNDVTGNKSACQESISSLPSATTQISDISSNLDCKVMTPWISGNILNTQQCSKQLAEQNNIYQQFEQQHLLERHDMQNMQLLQWQQLHQKQLEDNLVLAENQQMLEQVQQQQQQQQQNQQPFETNRKSFYTITSENRNNEFLNGILPSFGDNLSSDLYSSNFMNSFALSQQRQHEQLQHQQQQSQQLQQQQQYHHQQQHQQQLQQNQQQQYYQQNQQQQNQQQQNHQLQQQRQHQLQQQYQMQQQQYQMQQQQQHQLHLQ